MRPSLKVVLGFLAFSTVSFAQILNMGIPDAFQVTYVANLNVSQTNPALDSFINISNSGASIDFAESLLEGVALPGNHKRGPSKPHSILVSEGVGSICANIYAFDASEELLSCCSCVVTPGALAPIGISTSLLSNTATGEKPSSAVIKIVSTLDFGGCDPTNIDPFLLVSGMLGTRTTLHATTPGSFALTESPFVQSELSQGELDHLTTFCAFISANGAGGGVCTGCPTSNI